MDEQAPPPIEQEAPSEEKPKIDIPQLLRAISAAQRQTSLYGMDHPNTATVAESLIEPIHEMIKTMGKVTFIFTKRETIVNEHRYALPEAQLLFRRFRSRGVMAITFTGLPSNEQMRAFLEFLNEDPMKVREEGGPRLYLRKQGIRKIVATEAVYSVADNGEQSEDNSLFASDMDQAVAAAIDWLNRKESGDDDSPNIPVSEILADPYMTAKLIREAVTKMHKANTESSSPELANKAVEDLKSLTHDPENWDKALPQVRKAIAKLPEGFRPDGPALSAKRAIEEAHGGKRMMDICDIESMIEIAMQNTTAAQDGISALDMDTLNGLFDVQPQGLPSSWTKELQPTSMLQATGDTYSTILVSEEKPTEHGRVASAMAALVPRAVELKDTNLAYDMIENLASEAVRLDGGSWRGANARTALREIGLPMLRALVKQALESGVYRNKHVVAKLVSCLPDLAVSMADLIGAYRGESFDESLRDGLTHGGADALPILSNLVRTGSSTVRISAAEALIQMATPAALKQVVDLMPTAEEDWAIAVLDMVRKQRVNIGGELCMQALRHKSVRARRAAISAIGEIGYQQALPQVRELAHISIYSIRRFPEKIAAVRSLGMLGSEEDLTLLNDLAQRRSFIARDRASQVQGSALAAIRMIEKKKEPVQVQEKHVPMPEAA